MAALLLTLAMSVSLLAGCAGRTAEDEEEPIQVYLWTANLYEKYAPYVQAQLPDVDVEFVVGNNDLNFYKFLNENGELPDVITCCRFSLHDAQPLKDSLMDLSTSNEAGTVYNTYLNSFMNEDGSINWLPVCADAHGFVVNRSLFEKYGIPLPTDYDSFVSACKAFKKHGIRGFDADYTYDYTCMETLQGLSVSELSSAEGRQWRAAYSDPASTEKVGLDDTVWPTAFKNLEQFIRDTGLNAADLTLTYDDIMDRMRGFDPILAVTLAPADAFELWQIPLFILLGVLCGLMAWYFTSMNSRVGGFFKSIDKQYKKWLWGGAILGILIFVFPPLYGEGYEGFTSLMHGNAQELFNNSLFYRFRDIDWVIILFVIATMFFKVIAMSTTNAAGGVGGTFAPSLFVGAFTGASLALVCNTLFGWEVSIVSFTLVGMAGVMSGVMNAPLTSIFLIAELSNGYGLFIPLMITACISFAVDYYLDPDSIYTKQLRQKGELLTHDKDQSVFVFLKLEELMETDFLRIKENMTLGDIVHIISTARRNIFPVIDNFGRLIGVVQLDDLREDMFKHEKYGHPISDYMIPPPDKIIEHEAILSVMEKFEDKHAWMLPVVDKQGRYLGFISKSRILNAYREQLVKIQQ